MIIQAHTITSHELTEILAKTPVMYGYHQLPVGKLFICTLNNQIIAAAFCNASDQDVEQSFLKNYPHTQLCEEKINELMRQTSLALVFAGTDFQNEVLQAATKIPAGTTVTYQQLATTLGRPKAFRAVANALARNSIAYFIPCHRIVRATGALGGYRWGIEKKSALLKHEIQMSQRR